MVDNSLEEVVLHASVADNAVLVKADLVSGVVTPNMSFAVAKMGQERCKLSEGGAVFEVELLGVGAVVAHVAANPHPAGARVEDEVELMLLGADVDLRINLDVEEGEQLLVNVIRLIAVLAIEIHQVVTKTT